MKEFSMKISDQPGELAGIVKELGNAGVNILGLAGIGEAVPAVALVTNDEDATAKILDSINIDYSVRELIITTIPHEPGALAELTGKLGAAGINLRSIFLMKMEITTADIAFTANDGVAAKELLGL